MGQYTLLIFGTQYIYLWDTIYLLMGHYISTYGTLHTSKCLEHYLLMGHYILLNFWDTIFFWDSIYSGNYIQIDSQFLKLISL